MIPNKSNYPMLFSLIEELEEIVHAENTSYGEFLSEAYEIYCFDVNTVDRSLASIQFK